MNNLREGIELFLKGSANDSEFLIGKYHKGLETQIMVHPGAMEAESGRAWTDGQQNWSDSRWPYNAGSAPNYSDRVLTYSPSEHCSLIGTSWWDFEKRISVAVGLDIDTDEGHAISTTTVTDDFLKVIEKKLLTLPYVTLVRSKGGKGLHAYVFFDESDLPVSENHHRHKQHALAVLDKISKDLDYDMSKHVDAKGLILWLWADQIGENGFELIRSHQEPIGARDLDGHYENHYYEPTKSINGYNEDGMPVDEDIEGLEQKLFKLEEKHKTILKALEDQDYETVWVKEYNMLQTHTVALANVFKALDLKGRFETTSSGSTNKPNWDKVNCYITPRPGGGFRVTRFGSGIAEHGLWVTDEGKTYCFYNQAVPVMSILRRHASKSSSQGMSFSRGALQLCIDLLSESEPQVLPACSGPIVVKMTKQGGLKATNEDWNTPVQLDIIVEKDSPASVLPENAEDAETMCRLLVSEDLVLLGWALKTQIGWLYPVKESFVTDRLQVVFDHQAKGVRDNLVMNPWILDSFPFSPEYPGNRVWNKDAPQFKVKPSDVPGLCPHWDIILDHLGSSLDSVVRNQKWCQKWGINNGGDYLRYWLAALVKHPFSPLPYLFFCGRQETGKSMFHEMLSFIFTRGVMQANSALSSNAGYNGELCDSLLCYTEELNLSTCKRAYDKIKEYTTAKRIQIHPKNQTPYMQKNKMHFVQMSNSPTHLPIEEGDTRIVVVEVPQIETEIPKEVLEHGLKEEASWFIRQLLDIDLPDPINRLRIPVLSTNAKEDLEKESLTAAQTFVQSALFECDGHSVPVLDLYEKYKVFCAEVKTSPDSLAQFRNQLSPKWTVGRGKGNKNHVANVTMDRSKKPRSSPLSLNDSGRISKK